MHSNQSLINSIILAASRAGSFQLDSVRKLQKSDVESKGLNDFVSFVDKQSESMLIDDLSKIIPGSSFLAEESVKKILAANGPGLSILWMERRITFMEFRCSV